MSEVKRYDLVGDMDGNCNLNEARMELSDDGVYVKHNDYAALESKLAQLINENILLKSGISGLIHLGIRYADVDVMKMAGDAQLSTPYTDSIINSIVAGRYLKDDSESDASMAFETENQQFESLSNHKHHFIKGTCVECLKSE